MRKTDHNFPLRQFYRFGQSAQMRGAEKKGRMIVEYAAVIRIEFIPEGEERGPTADLYFKIFKMGTCGIVGGVFGWPTLTVLQKAKAFPG